MLHPDLVADLIEQFWGRWRYRCVFSDHNMSPRLIVAWINKRLTSRMRLNLNVDAVEKLISADFPAKLFPPATFPLQLQIQAVIFTAASMNNLL
jgi:hypothetical protein